MPTKDLSSNTGDASTLVIKPSRDKAGVVAVAVSPAAPVGAVVLLEVESVTDEWSTHMVTRTNTDARIASLGQGVAGWEALSAWQSVRVRRTDATGGACLVYLEVR